MFIQKRAFEIKLHQTYTDTQTNQCAHITKTQARAPQSRKENLTFCQIKEGLWIGQIIVDLEKALWLGQVEFGRHRIVEAATGGTKVWDARLKVSVSETESV